MPTELLQPSRACAAITESLRELCLSAARPWLVGFSGGDRGVHSPRPHDPVSPFAFAAFLAVPAGARQTKIAAVCTDTPIVIPDVVELIQSSLATTPLQRRSSVVPHNCQPDFRR